MQVEISKEGLVESCKLISGDSLLVEAATAAVKQWRYKPYLLNGEPIAFRTQVTVNFVLEGK